MRALVQPLDALDRKVLGGLVALWMTEPRRVRDREWTAERFVQIATVAHGFDSARDADAPAAATSEHVDTIRRYAEARMETVVRTALALFVRTAQDLQQRGGGFTFDDAQECVRRYLAVPFGGDDCP